VHVKDRPITIPCTQVVDAGAVPLLVLCVQEPELSLKRIAASSLSDIAKHTPELAQVMQFWQQVIYSLIWGNMGMLAIHSVPSTQCHPLSAIHSVPSTQCHPLSAIHSVSTKRTQLQQPCATLPGVQRATVNSRNPCSTTVSLGFTHLQAIVDAGAVAYLAPLVINQDAKLKRQVCGLGRTPGAL